MSDDGLEQLLLRHREVIVVGVQWCIRDHIFGERALLQQSKKRTSHEAPTGKSTKRLRTGFILTTRVWGDALLPPEPLSGFTCTVTKRHMCMMK